MTITTATDTNTPIESVTPTTIAMLPTWALEVAAKFASTDETRQALTCIHVKQSDGGFQIVSTDGHRLCRIRINYGADFSDFHWYLSDPELLISAKSVKKFDRYAQGLVIKSDGKADTVGGKVPRGSDSPPLDYLSSIAWRPDHSDTYYPDCDKLIPNKFTCNLGQTENGEGRPIAFNGKYVSEFGAVVAKYSITGVFRMVFNEPHTPAVMSCDVDAPFIPKGTLIEYLIMPVQLRA